MTTRGIHRIASALVVALIAAFVPLGASASAVSIAVAPPPATLRSVKMLDASTAVAVATNGTIWRTTNAGADWTQVRTADAYDFRAVDFWNATKGVAVDLQGKVAQTGDGGVSWSNVSFAPYADMDGLTASKNHHGLACIPGTTDMAISVGGDPDIEDSSYIGPVAMRTGGALNYWQHAFFQAQPHQQDDGLGNLTPVGEGEFYDVDFASTTHGWAVGRDTFLPGPHTAAVYRTTNSGEAPWTKLTLGFPATLNAVAFGTTTAGVTAGQSTADATPRVYYTTNAGTSWTQGTLPAGTGTPRALHMTSATQGWLAGDGGTLLRTTDGGVTWTPCTKPAGFIANLYDIELVGTTGIAVGANTVLTTTDGINWTGVYAPPSAKPVARIAGADRITTAIEASKVAFPTGAPTVVIATARNWPDALGGAALAGAVGGPILLTEPGALPASVSAEITRLKATKAIVLGGIGAVSPAVETALKTKLGAANVDRVAGADRYETARKVAAETVARAGTFDGTAFVATGANFPDALAASPLAAFKRWPIYLVRPTGVDDALVAAMNDAGVNKVVILGGTGAVPTAVENALKTRVPGTYTRRAGTDRYETARVVAAYGVSNAGLSWDKVAVATGANFPDALSGGVLQAQARSVMLLTPSAALHEGARQTLVANRGVILSARVLGGTGAVSPAVYEAVRSAIQ